MTRCWLLLCPALLLGMVFGSVWVGAQEAPSRAEFPQMKMVELERGLKVGYAVKLVDVDHDGKLDIVVVDTDRVLWYQNPTWKQRIILQGGTKPDNVCISPYDIDGDGKVDFALGADWHPSNTAGGGTLQWLRRKDSLDQPWEIIPIASEATLHRIRFADLDGNGKKELIAVPLFGTNSTPARNWMDAPVRILAFHIPKDPVRQRWQPEVLNENLHVIHNFYPIAAQDGKGKDVLVACYEGVYRLSRHDGKWQAEKLGTGNQDNPGGKRGASEIKMGRLKSGKKFIATIEPWHGHQVVVYSEPEQTGQLWQRHVIDDQLRWGHAVWCADLDKDGGDELIIGVRDDPAPKEKVKDRRGVRLYKAQDDRGSRWTRHILDKGGIACEDLAVADLNGDGLPDIVAVGRQTHNMRIYWNEGARQAQSP